MFPKIHTEVQLTVPENVMLFGNMVVAVVSDDEVIGESRGLMQCACAFTKSRSLGADVYMGECYMKQ